MTSPLDALRRHVRSHREELARFVADLIAIPTENPPGDSTRECLDVVARHLAGLGFDPRVEAVPGSESRFWLACDWGEGEAAVYFHGHIDVVPAQDPAQFEPEVTEETIFGRGSADMKGGLASMIYAMKAVAD